MTVTFTKSELVVLTNALAVSPTTGGVRNYPIETVNKMRMMREKLMATLRACQDIVTMTLTDDEKQTLHDLAYDAQYPIFSGEAAEALRVKLA